MAVSAVCNPGEIIMFKSNAYAQNESSLKPVVGR